MAPSTCGLSWIRYNSIVRVPSVRTFFSVSVSKTARVPDRESLSGAIVLGAAKILA